MTDDPQATKFVRADQLGPVKPRVPEENATPVVDGALDLHWVSPGYCWALDRIQTPHDLISMMHHLMCKKSDRAQVTHFMGLVEAVYHTKGWNLYGKTPGAK